MIYPLNTHSKSNLEIHDLKSFITSILPEQTVPVRHNSFLLIWIQEGKGSYYADQKTLPIINDTIYCACPGITHILTAGSSLKGYAVSFSQRMLSSVGTKASLILNHHLLSFNAMKPIRIGAEIKFELEQLVHSMIKESLCASQYKTEILQALLQLFLMNVVQSVDNISAEDLHLTGETNLVSQFLELVHRHFMTMKKVTDYAKKLGVTPNYLTIKIKTITGFPASYHITQRIVLEAKRQACCSHLSLKEIAYMLGYGDLSHFSKLFKRTAGINFSHFKRIGPESFI